MKRRTLFVMALVMTLVTVPVMAMEDHSGKASGEGTTMKGHSGMDSDKGATMNGSGMDAFKHQASKDGMDATFQVMSLASMNMAAENGDTHHVMVNLSKTDGGEKIKEAKGKIKVIGPDGKEQVSSLKNYGGILAANFIFKEPGKYGVICLVKNSKKEHLFKFWYEHM